MPLVSASLVRRVAVVGATLVLALTEVTRGSDPGDESYTTLTPVSEVHTTLTPTLTPVTEVHAAAQRASSDGSPELPRQKVDVPELRVTGRTIHVPADGDLQKALDEAEPGDRITLEPRATYRGPFRLRNKSGNGWIVVTSAAADLPRPGRHVSPADASRMPRLVAGAGSVFEAQPGAHHFRLVALEITPASGTSLNTLVRLGEDEPTLDALPHHVVVDRCYIHGDARLGGRRGVGMNGAHLAVVDSYLSDFKERTVDAQAIAGWNGPGPFLIAGNYLEASGENIMFGGADPRIKDLVPADIEVRSNHLAKPLRWKKDHPSFEGTEWAVKNLFELKNARRVLVDGNLLEYNWPQAQNGFAVLFTVRNQDGGAPWSVVEDVTFSNNLVRHVAAGINVLGRDDNNPSQRTRRLAIRNNVFADVGGTWGNGRLFQLLHGTEDVVIDHNTAMQTGSPLFGGDSDPHGRFVFQNNVMPLNEHGIIGSSTGPGNPTIERYFPQSVIRRNVFVGGPSNSYPRDNFFAASPQEAGLEPAAAAARFAVGRKFAAQATDGRDPGADMAALERALGSLAATAGIGPGTARPVRRTGSLEVSRPAPRLAAMIDLGPLENVSLAVLMFWLAAGLLAYTYFGYPIVAALRAALQPSRRVRAPIEPTVSIVVVAYNEAHRIAARIENLLALDYPAERLQIVVASDGSTDQTVAQARPYENHVVRVVDFKRRRGKAAVLSTVVPRLSGDIVVFADARQRFDANTLRALVRNFADPTVGGVSGEQVLWTRNAPAAAGRGAAFYWRYEKFIRSTEGRADSTIGATGAIYAIRRAVFEPIPHDTILDDVLIPLRVVRQGYRMVFEPSARAYDNATPTARQEFVRKSRTIAGTFQLFWRERWLFSPSHNRLWFETMSHKALRLALPVLHVVLLAATCVIATQWVYGWALAAQAAFYGAALAGYCQRQRRSAVFTVPCAMCVLLWATVVGFYRFAMRRQQATWERSAPISSANNAGSTAAA